MTGKQLTWIIDTWTFNHMKGTLEILHDIRENSNCSIELPNKSQVAAIMEGSVNLDENLSLKNIFFCA